MTRTYRRSRADYPKGVIAIYDYGKDREGYVDRYTVVYAPEDHWFSYYMLDDNGMGCHGEVEGRGHLYASWGGMRGCGKTIAFTDLPQVCQDAVGPLS